MMVVAVTGGIGSGKSYVCSFLQQKYGWPVYEADSRVKDLYHTHESLLSDIESALGIKLRDSDGRFQPRLLASVIFNDIDSLTKVEELVFPVLSEDFQIWKQQHSDNSCVILESATILQKPQLRWLWDLAVLVDAPLEIRAARAAERDGVPQEQIWQRMQYQNLMNDISSGKVSSPTDYTIINDGSIEELNKNIDKLVEKIA